MSTQTLDSVRQLLADLHAERMATWKPDELQVNIDQRQLLVDTLDHKRLVKEGDRVEPFSLLDVDGGAITLDDLVADGPAVLIFFRFAGCPACNIALPYYHRQLYPALSSLGIPLVAVSPQIPERLAAIKERHGLSFRVASDIGNTLGHKLGIVFAASDASQAAATLRGSFIGDVTGTGTWELPMPTILVIDSDRVVRFADVSPDWLVRTEADTVIEAVRSLQNVAVAAE